MERSGIVGPNEKRQRFFRALLAVYLTYVLYLSNTDLFVSVKITLVILLGAAFFFLLINRGLQRLCDQPYLYQIEQETNSKKQKRDALFFAISFFLCFSLLTINWVACYPGSGGYDVHEQLEQALSNVYTNWHPAFHTFLIRLGMLLTQDYALLVLLQIFLFSLSFSYFYLGIRTGRRAIDTLLLMIEFFLVLSPIIENTLTYMLKDNALTIGALLLTGFSVRIYFSKGAWMKQWWNMLFFSFTAAFCSLMRHNGFFYTLPAIILLFLCYRTYMKQTCIIFISTLLLFGLVRFPLYQSLGVTYPDNFVDESTGLPMTVLADAMVTQPEVLDQETHDYMLQLASQEAWNHSGYLFASYNSIKWTLVNRLEIRKTPITKVLRMTVHTALARPAKTFAVLNEATDLVWGLNHKQECTIDVDVDYGLPGTYHGYSAYNILGGRINEYLGIFSSLPFVAYLTQNVGVQLVFLFLSALIALRNGPGALFLVLPIACYAFGTMLLLCGNDARFFQFIMAIGLPLSIAMLRATDETPKALPRQV